MMQGTAAFILKMKTNIFYMLYMPVRTGPAGPTASIPAYLDRSCWSWKQSSPIKSYLYHTHASLISSLLAWILAQTCSPSLYLFDTFNGICDIIIFHPNFPRNTVRMWGGNWMQVREVLLRECSTCRPTCMGSVCYGIGWLTVIGSSCLVVLCCSEKRFDCDRQRDLSCQTVIVSGIWAVRLWSWDQWVGGVSPWECVSDHWRSLRELPAFCVCT